MASLNLPDSVSTLVRQHIHSVLQLEVLLLLRERGGVWDATTLSADLRITEGSAEIRLHDLELRGFLAQEGSDTFRYAPLTPELAAAVDDLAECYDRMRYTVINLIFSIPGDSARSLADAFRFRKRRDD